MIYNNKFHYQLLSLAPIFLAQARDLADVRNMCGKPENKKSPAKIDLRAILLFKQYPEPGSNRHGCYPIGV